MQVTVLNKKGPLTTQVQAGRHRLIADEPIDMGGQDQGPTPYDFLLTALGSCTAITLRLYANRKEWDLEEVIVSLSHNKDYPSDCKDCESESAKIDVITREIQFKGQLDDSQKDRLLQIANKCPVHKTLITDTEIRTSLST